MKMRFLVLAAWLPALAQAEDAWLARDVDALRFPDGKTISANLEQGDKVEVLFREGELVRVLSGAKFGWVPADVLLAEAPVDDEALDLPALPDDLGEDLLAPPAADDAAPVEEPAPATP